MFTKGGMDSSGDSKYDQKKGRKGDENMLDARAVSPTTPAVDDWVTTGQAAKMLEVGITTVKRWLKTGRLEGRRLGGESGWIQINVASIQALLQANDPEVTKRQAIERSLEEMRGLGGELSEEELDDISMSKLGKLPWQV